MRERACLVITREATIMNERFSFRILAIFIIFPACHAKELCQLDEVKKDIFFLLDSSGSVGGRNFKTAKYFIAGFINRLPIGPNDTHVAIIRFSSKPKRYASLNSYYSKRDLTAAVMSILYNDGITNTAEALEFSRKKLMKKYRGDRKDVENIIIIITDGSSTSLPGKLRREVAILHKMGVVIAAIGVGAMVNKTELDAMASEERFSFAVDNYRALFEIQSSLFGVACQTLKAIPDLAAGTSPNPETTGQTGLDSTAESQTVSTLMSSLHKTLRNPTQELPFKSHVTSKVNLQTVTTGITRNSYSKTSLKETTTKASSKMHGTTLPTSGNKNNSLVSVTEMGRFDHTKDSFVGSSTEDPIIGDAPGTQNEIDVHKSQKEFDDKNYFISKSKGGFSTKVQNDFNIMLYTIIGFAVVVAVSGVVVIATRKYRMKMKRRKRGLETV